MADIRKRKSSRTGKVTYQARYKDRTGKFRYITRATRKAATRDLNKAQDEIARGTHVHDRDTVTISAALDLWIEVCETVGRHGREPVTNATLRKYKERAGNHLKPLAGPWKLNQITAPMAVQLRDDLLRRCPRPTAKKCLTDLKSALAEARARGLMATNPFESVFIRDSGRAQRRMTIPTAQDMAAIERASQALSLKRQAQFWTLRLSGCRPEEMRGLIWPCVVKPALRVERAANEDCELVEMTKTANGYRSIGCPDALFVMLTDWRRECPISPHHLVFPTEAGTVESHGNVTRRMWYPLLKATGMDFDLYALRHYRISERLKAGENLIDVSEQAGHATPEFTLRTYAQVIREIRS